MILDHHILDENTPISDNCILINNQTSERYKNKDLTGAGVTWQFCRYVDKQLGTNYAWDLVDLAALGIISDMGDYRSLENRYIIKEGLNNIKNYFFQKACEKQDYSMKGEKNYNSVAFYITPLLNSMIRVGTAAEKERVFLAFIDGHHLVPCNKRGAKGTMEEVAIESLRECTNTKSKQDKITTAAVDNLSIRIFNEELDKNKLLIVELDNDDDYPQEVNGLVAMKLASKYNLPTLLGRTNEDGEIKGSIRGMNNSELTSLRDFLLGSGYVEWVTGHDNAAGWCAKKKKISALIDYANQELADFDFNSSYYEVDFIRRGDAKDLYQIISDIGGHDDIWGQGIKEALINITDLYVNKNQIQIIGSRKDTLKFVYNGITYIKFFAKDLIEQLNNIEGSLCFNVVGKMNMNYYNGSVTPQIMIENYEVIDSRLMF